MTCTNTDFGMAVLCFDFLQGTASVSNPQRGLHLHRAQWGGDGERGDGLVFCDALGRAELDVRAMSEVSRALDGIKALTIGGWFYCHRLGEQSFFSRGLPQFVSEGCQIFPPGAGYVCFSLGTDRRGFFQGVVNGNGLWMTLSTVAPGSWSQLVISKSEDGYQTFFHNGQQIYCDRDSCWSPDVRPFQECSDQESEPIRLMAPAGGAIGEVWIFPRALSAEEISSDFQAKQHRYQPGPGGQSVDLREIDSHPVPGLWPRPLITENWPQEQQRILRGVRKVMGGFPKEVTSLEPEVLGEDDCGDYVRRKVSFAVQPNDRMPAYLLIPKEYEKPAPAIICIYGSTQGAGKDVVVGLSGPAHGLPLMKNRAFALDMVQAGFVVLAGDYLRDGERLLPGQKPYDSTAFYEEFPDWSIVGKDTWDSSRAIDFLQTLPFVDGERIGMVGHSYGGHNTIFAAALDARIRVAVANGPVSNFRNGDHWGRPPGMDGGQYMPALRPYVLDHSLPLPITFYEWTSLIAPRPLLVGQAIGEWRPGEEENHAAVRQVYEALGCGDRVRYHWYASDHDFPPVARRAAVEWFKRWL